MLQQDEQAKMEKFIETMPTIIQTHFNYSTQLGRGY